MHALSTSQSLVNWFYVLLELFLCVSLHGQKFLRIAVVAGLSGHLHYSQNKNHPQMFNSWCHPDPQLMIVTYLAWAQGCVMLSGPHSDFSPLYPEWADTVASHGGVQGLPFHFSCREIENTYR